MAGFKVTVDQTELKRLLGSISKSVRNLEAPLTGWGNKLIAQTKDQFVTETDPDGDRWAALSPTTLMRKARLGQPSRILTATGAMSNSFRITVAPMQLDLKSDSPILKYHQKGTSRMPKRRVLGITATRKNEGAGIVRAYIKGRVRK